MKQNIYKTPPPPTDILNKQNLSFSVEAKSNTEISNSDQKNISNNCLASQLIDCHGGFAVKKYIQVSDELSFGEHHKLWKQVSKFSNNKLRKWTLKLSNTLARNCTKDQRQKFFSHYRRFKHLLTHEQMTMFKVVVLEAQFGLNININHQIPPEIQSIFSTHFPALFSSLGDIANKWSARLIRLVITLIECSSDSSYGSKLRSLLSFLSDFVGCDFSHYAQVLAHAFQGLFTTEQKLVAQSYSAETIGQSLFSVFTSLFTEQGPQEMKMETLRIKRLENFWKIAKNTKDILNFVYSVLQEWIDYYTTQLFGCTISDKVMLLYNRDIPNWMKEVSDIYNKCGLQESARSFEVAERVIQLKKDGDGYLIHLQNLKTVPAGVMAYFLNIYNQAKEMAKNAMALAYNDKSRFSPFVLFMFGESGIGKSTAQDFILKDIFNYMDKTFDYTRDVYVRNTAQDHWDGYIGQKVVVFDDYLQNRDEQIMRSECNELIHMKNTTSYPLKMASLDDKGTVRFVSDVVMISSNSNFTHDLSCLVTEPKAVKRRRDVVVQVKLRDEFRLNNGRIDLMKIRNDLPFDPFVYDFCVLDPMDDQLIQIFDYKSFIQYCSQVWTKIRADDTRLLNSIPTWDIRLIAQGGFTKYLYNLNTSIFTLPDWQEVMQSFTSSLKSQVVENLPLKIATLTLAGLGLIIGIGWLVKSTSTRELPSQSIDREIFKSSVISSESNISGDFKTIHLRPKIKARVLIRDFAPESNISGDMRTQFLRPKIMARSIQSAEGQIDAQMASDPQVQNVIGHRLLHNIARIYIGKGVINGLFICDTLLLLPTHLFALHEGELTIVTRINTWTISLNQAERKDFPEYDLSILKLPRSCGQYTSIIKHFHKGSDLEKYDVHSGVLVVSRHCGAEHIPHLMDASNIQTVTEPSYVVKTADGETVQDVEIISGFMYDSQTVAGDCGSPLLVTNSAMQRKILGLHVAGSKDLGLSVELSQEILIEMTQQFNDIYIQEAPVCESADLTQEYLIAQSDKVETYGVVQASKQYRLPTKTGIFPSVVHNMFKAFTKPALLRPLRNLNPMQKAIKDQFIENIVLDEGDMSMIVLDLINYYKIRSKTHYKRIYSLQECINGIKGDPWVRPIDKLTSPGYPFVLERTKLTGKLAFLTGEENEYQLREDVYNEFRDMEEAARNGIVPTILFCDTLKDERREIEKVDAGKTRVFNVGPFHFNLLVRKYFLGFIATVMNVHNTSEISVGINPHNAEWGILFKRLQQNDDNWIAGDFSKYDKRLPYHFLDQALAIIQSFYQDEHRVIRQSLWIAMFNAFHLCGSEVYRCRQGNPSGNPLTVIINSLVNQMIMRFAYLRSARSVGVSRSLIDFNKNIRLAVYGDDNIATVSIKDKDFFNMQTIAKILGEYNIVYTSPTKTTSNDRFMCRSEVTFLKRRFELRSGWCHAPLPMRIIEEMMLWKRGKISDLFALTATWNSVITELSHYDRSLYEKQMAFILGFVGTKGYRLSPISYNDALASRLAK